MPERPAGAPRDIAYRPNNAGRPTTTTSRGHASNPVDYSGIRASALYQINDDWDVLISQSYQNMEADGEFTQYPDRLGRPGARALAGHRSSVPRTTRISSKTPPGPSTARSAISRRSIPADTWCATSTRPTTTSNYARSAYGFYYTCSGGTGGGGFGRRIRRAGDDARVLLADHLLARHGAEHPPEPRVSPEHAGRLADRAAIVGRVLGGFRDPRQHEFPLQDHPVVHPGQSRGRPRRAARHASPTSVRRRARPPRTRACATTISRSARTSQRGYKQTAVFTSVDYDIIPKVLTVTGGTR